MRRQRALAVVMGGTVVAACGLDVIGIQVTSSATVDATTDAMTDASLSGRDSGGTREEETGASCPIVDGGVDGGARSAIVTRADGLDAGDGGHHHFASCPAIVLARGTAAYVRGAPVATEEIRLEWEPDALWVQLDVTDATLAGTNSNVFDNDSVEIYLSSDPNRGADYSTKEHQVIVDYRGKTLYATAGGDVGPYPEAWTQTTSRGYEVEIRIDKSKLGGTLTRGSTLFFDALLSDGVNQDNFAIWAEQPHGGTAGSPYPAGDPRVFAPITLE